MRITLAKVAAATGVSVSAISQVLNHHPNAQTLRPETRKKILETVRKMGYCRNENAAMVRTGISKTVALIIECGTKAMDNCAANVLLGMLCQAAQSEFCIKVYNTADVDKIRDELLRYQIQHAVVFSFSKDFQQMIGLYCRKYDIRLCYIQESCQDGFPLVYDDDFAAVRAVVKKLVAEGHRRIALVRPEEDIVFSVDRGRGYLAGLADAGIPRDDSIISSRCNENDHYQDLFRMFALPDGVRPTAFVCTDDNRAMRVEMVALKCGKMRGCKIVGYGDTNANSFLYPVDTVSQPFAAMGAKALDVVTGDPKKWEKKYYLPVEYMEYAQREYEPFKEEKTS